MGDLRIDYSGLLGQQGETKTGGAGGGSHERGDGKKAGGKGSGGFGVIRPRRIGALLFGFAVLATLPFALLIRGGVLAYEVWGVGTWPALALSAAATAALLAGYAWFLTRRFGASRGVRKVVIRAAAGVALAWVVYGLVFVASENVKSDDVASEYAGVHPLLRLAASALILVDPASVITDASRTLDDYRAMGLPPNEASLHFEQSTGYVHALDLRTAGRPEWRNRLVALGFAALGFHSLRHVGTADHLHLSLSLPG